MSFSLTSQCLSDKGEVNAFTLMHLQQVGATKHVIYKCNLPEGVGSVLAQPIAPRGKLPPPPTQEKDSCLTYTVCTYSHRVAARVL